VDRILCTPSTNCCSSLPQYARAVEPDRLLGHSVRGKLRPLCRSLLWMPRPWLAFELRAFGLSAVAGTFATITAEAVKLKGARIVWADSLDDWLQFSLILFLWSTLYFSIKQWQQSARERDRLVRAEFEARAARLNALRISSA
jgi:hypothetical protein